MKYIQNQNIFQYDMRYTSTLVLVLCVSVLVVGRIRYMRESKRDGSRVLSSVILLVLVTRISAEGVTQASVACKHKRVEDKLESEKNARVRHHHRSTEVKRYPCKGGTNRYLLCILDNSSLTRKELKAKLSEC